mmetsp:Transcript_21431/g.64155  ORF Transcript_21431/g.64155 Transcript_21431/m.64155 type:complete len:210 (+) Transcript_21431:198-827(+)
MLYNSMDAKRTERRQFKVVLLGDGAVGKTSIATRFSRDEFKQSYKQTIGLDFFIKHLLLSEQLHIAMQIWDIGGQSVSSKMIHNYVLGAHAILLCYDITNYESFADLEDWHRIVRETFGTKSVPFVGLVANKCDLSHMRAVKSEAHQRFAEENVLHSFMMSAKSGDQVHSCFLHVAELLSKAEFPASKNEAKAEMVPEFFGQLCIGRMV